MACHLLISFMLMPVRLLAPQVQDYRNTRLPRPLPLKLFSPIITATTTTSAAATVSPSSSAREEEPFPTSEAGLLVVAPILRQRQHHLCAGLVLPLLRLPRSGLPFFLLVRRPPSPDPRPRVPRFPVCTNKQGIIISTTIFKKDLLIHRKWKHGRFTPPRTNKQCI